MKRLQRVYIQQHFNCYILTFSKTKHNTGKDNFIHAHNTQQNIAHANHDDPTVWFYYSCPSIVFQTNPELGQNNEIWGQYNKIILTGNQVNAGVICNM